MVLKVIVVGLFLQFLCVHARFRTTSVTRIPRAGDDGIPSSPPWVFPKDIKPRPICMSAASAQDCRFSINSSCYAQKCTMTLFGGCMQTDLLVDKSCFCTKDLSSNSCSACRVGRSRALYLSWLNGTCGDIKSWHGLSSNWVSELPTIDHLVWVGNRTASTKNSYSYRPACAGSFEITSRGCDLSYFPQWDFPAQTSCTAANSSIWEPNIYNATEAVAATPSQLNKTYSPWFNSNSPKSYDPTGDSGLYLDLNGFCRSAYSNSSGTCDATPRFKLLLWASTKCTPPQDYGWPENWKDSLPVMNSSFIEASAVPPLLNVNVSNAQNCSQWINSTVTKCTSQRCKGSTCDEVVTAVEIACVCKDKNFLEKCKPTALEQTVDFLWFNKTCGPVSDFPGFSGAWESSLLTMNSSFGSPGDFMTWPRCANKNGCSTSLNATVTSCTRTLCNVDPKTGLCNSTSPAVRPDCYCSPRKCFDWLLA